jgi:hypothetical protein
VTLDDVVLRENGFGGLWVDDHVNASPASVDVRVTRSRILGNNTAGIPGPPNAAVADKDGIRVNEGGPGDLRLEVLASWFEDNQADGLELDETGPGDVRANVTGTSFVNNGAQLQFPSDLEDGFDIDEAGNGSIYANLLLVHVTGHMDEGIDYDELDAGSVFANMTLVSSLANQDDNVSITESEEIDDPSLADPAGDGTGSGDIAIDFRLSSFSEQIDNGDGDGVKLEEFGVGDVGGRIAFSRIANNDDDGIQVDEQGPGGGTLALHFVTFEGNGDDDVTSDVDVVTTP